MNDKIIVGSFAVLIGSMAVKVFKTIGKSRREEKIEEVTENELQN